MDYRMQCLRLTQRRTAHRARLNRNRQSIDDRYRDTPTLRDIERGDALNAAWRQLAASGSFLQRHRDTVTIPSAVIRQLPLRSAPDAVTIQLGDVQTLESLPAALRNHVVRVGATRLVNYLEFLSREPETSLGELLSFMEAYHLQFGVAETVSERAALRELYPHLARLRDAAQPSPRVEKTADMETP
jgi:hypothetical protein